MYWHSDLTKLTAPWSAVLTVAILVKWRPKFRRQLKQEEARRKPLRNAQFPRFMFNVSINLLRNVFCIIIWIYILVLWSTYWKIEGFLWGFCSVQCRQKYHHLNHQNSNLNDWSNFSASFWLILYIKIFLCKISSFKTPVKF